MTGSRGSVVSVLDFQILILSLNGRNFTKNIHGWDFKIHLVPNWSLTDLSLSLSLSLSLDLGFV